MVGNTFRSGEPVLKIVRGEGMSSFSLCHVEPRTTGKRELQQRRAVISPLEIDELKWKITRMDNLLRLRKAGDFLPNELVRCRWVSFSQQRASNYMTKHAHARSYMQFISKYELVMYKCKTRHTLCNNSQEQGLQQNQQHQPRRKNKAYAVRQQRAA